MKKNIFEWFIALLLTTFVGSIYSISGNYMDPTFKNKNELVINKITLPFHTINREYIIVSHAWKGMENKEKSK